MLGVPKTMLLIVNLIMGPNTNNILVKISFTRKCISKYRLQMFDHIVQVTMSTITKPGLWANVFRTASWHGNIFRVTGPLWGEFIGDRWFPSPRKQQPRLWCFFFIWAQRNVWTNSRGVGDFRRHETPLWRHYNGWRNERSIWLRNITWQAFYEY